MTTTTYAPYRESGPKRRRTMAHALGLRACAATGPTIGAARSPTPAYGDARLPVQSFVGATCEVEMAV